MANVGTECITLEDDSDEELQILSEKIPNFGGTAPKELEVNEEIKCAIMKSLEDQCIDIPRGNFKMKIFSKNGYHVDWNTLNISQLTSAASYSDDTASKAYSLTATAKQVGINQQDIESKATKVNQLPCHNQTTDIINDNEVNINKNIFSRADWKLGKHGRKKLRIKDVKAVDDKSTHISNQGQSLQCGLHNLGPRLSRLDDNSGSSFGIAGPYEESFDALGYFDCDTFISASKLLNKQSMVLLKRLEMSVLSSAMSPVKELAGNHGKQCEPHTMPSEVSNCNLETLHLGVNKEQDIFPKLSGIRKHQINDVPIGTDNYNLISKKSRLKRKRCKSLGHVDEQRIKLDSDARKRSKSSVEVFGESVPFSQKELGVDSPLNSVATFISVAVGKPESVIDELKRSTYEDLSVEVEASFPLHGSGCDQSDSYCTQVPTLPLHSIHDKVVCSSGTNDKFDGFHGEIFYDDSRHINLHSDESGINQVDSLSYVEELESKETTTVSNDEILESKETTTVSNVEDLECKETKTESNVEDLKSKVTTTVSNLENLRSGSNENSYDDRSTKFLGPSELAKKYLIENCSYTDISSDNFGKSVYHHNVQVVPDREGDSIGNSNIFDGEVDICNQLIDPSVSTSPSIAFEYDNIVQESMLCLSDYFNHDMEEETQQIYEIETHQRYDVNVAKELVLVEKLEKDICYQDVDINMLLVKLGNNIDHHLKFSGWKLTHISKEAFKIMCDEKLLNTVADGEPVVESAVNDDSINDLENLLTDKIPTLDEMLDKYLAEELPEIPDERLPPSSGGISNEVDSVDPYAALLDVQLCMENSTSSSKPDSLGYDYLWQLPVDEFASAVGLCTHVQASNFYRKQRADALRGMCLRSSRSEKPIGNTRKGKSKQRKDQRRSR